tara:strand:+ start:278 stop:484 length:207 start_codon:yes stop_codon:yes gene_type:complete
MKKYQTNNQQNGTAMRPQLPSDMSAGGDPYYKSGTLPKGGFQSMWCFGGSSDRKNSPTDMVKGQKKVY